MSRAGSTAWSGLVLSALISAGCASNPGAPPSSDQVGGRSQETVPRSTPAGNRPASQPPTKPCAYRVQRGVAWLERFDGEWAWFGFMPGDRRIKLPALHSWQPGEEFRAEWYAPDLVQKHCRARLELVAPLP